MTSNQPEEVYLQWQEAYFHWLVPQVQEEGHQRKTYWDLFRIMFQKEFVWLVPNDDNRIIDGTDLRTEFLLEADAPRFVSPDGFGPCSVLELIVGLGRRLSFFAGGNAEGWSWQLVVNLELHRLSDPLGKIRSTRANEILDRMIWRNYNPDGTGGLFPLAWPQEDQKKVELWYQMSAYVEEIHPEY